MKEVSKQRYQKINVEAIIYAKLKDSFLG